MENAPYGKFAEEAQYKLGEALQKSERYEEAVQAFQYLNVLQAAQVLTSLDESRQLACLSSIPSVMGSRVLRTMATDDAADILQKLDPQDAQRILKEMPFDQDTRSIQHLLMEEPDSAAGLMSTDYISININKTVGDAMQLIRQAEEKDFIYYCYLTDDDNHLVGVVSLKSLIIYDEDAPLSRLAQFDVKALKTTDDQEFVASIFRKYYNLLAMPVSDPDDILCGVVTIDDIIDVIEEESSEEIYRASGISLEEIDERNLITGPVMDAVKARLPWLSITVFGQILASFIIASQAGTVAKAVIAISFMPLLTGLSGNMGTQTNTIAVRGLGQNLITSVNIWEKTRREMLIALITGFTFSLFVGTFSYLIYHHWVLSLLLFVWITASMCISATAGIWVPYLGDKVLKVDPASMGGPLISTVSDILTFRAFAEGTDWTLFFAERDVLGMQHALRRLLEDRELRAQVRAKGLEIAQQYTFARVAERIEQVLGTAGE
ncbi:MAG: magnesium transporter [Deltaproteobacteria bacterium]|nr:magnesium transporter [Deltaproteobacteria bacterium]